jgi:hypothetical protein
MNGLVNVVLFANQDRFGDAAPRLQEKKLNIKK